MLNNVCAFSHHLSTSMSAEILLFSSQKRAAVKTQEKAESASVTKSTSAKVSVPERARSRRSSSPGRSSSEDDSKAASSSPGTKDTLPLCNFCNCGLIVALLTAVPLCIHGDDADLSLFVTICLLPLVGCCWVKYFRKLRASPEQLFRPTIFCRLSTHLIQLNSRPSLAYLIFCHTALSATPWLNSWTGITGAQWSALNYPVSFQTAIQVPPRDSVFELTLSASNRCYVMLLGSVSFKCWTSLRTMIVRNADLRRAVYLTCVHIFNQQMSPVSFQTVHVQSSLKGFLTFDCIFKIKSQMFRQINVI